MFAGWGPMADLFYGALVLLLTNPGTLQLLTQETRETFPSYGDIVPSKTLLSLPYLHAVIEETLRLLPSNNTGLPRISPGAVVDGTYIPRGVSTNSSVLSSHRVSY
jgi:cytochrome P450